MATVLLVIHLMIAVALVGLVLLQKSEGGALGIGGGGGGGGSGGFMTGRGAGSALTRATAILAAGFFVTSLGLALIAKRETNPGTIFGSPSTSTPAAPGSGGGVLDSLKRRSQPSEPAAPSVPQGQ